MDGPCDQQAQELRPSRHARSFSAVTLLLLLAFMSLMLSSCLRKIARVPVTNEDVIRSNEISREADILFARKDYYAALIKYLEAGRLNPNSEFIYNRIGITYSQLSYYQEAIAAFRRSMQLNPKYSYSVNNLGSVYFALKDLKKSEKYFRKAVGMNSTEPSFHMNLGTLYFERKKYDKAMAAWRKGLALDPDILSRKSNVSLVGGSTPSKEKNYFMARLYAASGDVLRAIECLEQAFMDGFSDIEAIDKQADFDPIRKDSRFVEFMKNVELLIKLRSRSNQPARDPQTAVPPTQPANQESHRSKIAVGG